MTLEAFLRCALIVLHETCECKSVVFCIETEKVSHIALSHCFAVYKQTFQVYFFFFPTFLFKRKVCHLSVKKCRIFNLRRVLEEIFCIGLLFFNECV